MLRRITLKNFMSHKHTVIDLADGLTVLTGPNNCGKSALVAALQILATNCASTHVVRHGEKKCVITAETDDGHTLSWHRKKGKVGYTLNGEDVHRLGRGEVPVELQSLLKLPTVETEVGKTTGNYDVHFGEQKSPIFLLGEPGSRAASFFASSSDATHLITMQSRHRQRVGEHRRDEKKLLASAASTAADLQRYSTMDDVDARLQQAEQDFAKIDSAVKKIAEIKSLVSKINSVASTRSRLAARLLNLEKLASPPFQHDVEAAGAMIGRLKVVNSARTNASNLLSVCEPLSSPPELHQVSDCRNVGHKLVSLRLRISQIIRRQAAVSRIQPPPTVFDTDRLALLVDGLPSAAARKQALVRQLSVLSDLTVQPRTDSTNELLTLIGQLKNRHAQLRHEQRVIRSFKRLSVTPKLMDTLVLSGSINTIRKQQLSVFDYRTSLNDAVSSLDECHKRVRQFVAASPECPTCGAPLDADTLVFSSSKAGIPSHSVVTHHNQGATE